MTHNILTLKTINQLHDLDFFIPAYQRGYRWDSNQVEDLLNDIDNFNPKEVPDSDDKTWYCLQPIVVKECQDTDKDSVGMKTFEVIDGQQRLTSIYLISYFLNQYYAEDYQKRLFNLTYETRKDSTRFLEELDKEISHNNIDYFHISNAYKTIKDWFKAKGSSFNRTEFETNFGFHTKVIWYESLESNSIQIFTRINIGKIPLTNSELIKALFLNSSNFKENDERLKLRQLEIATEWDFIEQSLQRDKFWYFLTGNKKSVNRIEFIFDLMNDLPDENDKYSTFRFFNEKFISKKTEVINHNWLEIKKRFQRFNEWYQERDLYHKIGYLISVDYINIKELYDKSSEMTKSEFRTFLDSLIKESVKNIDIQSIQYHDGENVRKILLLYNVLTILKSETDNSYFPFAIYKNEKWDIEHITSIKNYMPDKNREEWLNDAKVFIDSTIDKKGRLLKQIEKFKDFQDGDKFKVLYEEIVSHFNHNVKDEDLNDLSNLTLLDSSTNRSYKNAVFPIKRKTIIDRDKQGVFIPLCTKNVFLKYFSEYPPKISFWTQEDRENYEKDLEKVLNPYLNV
ncbi:DUF262 domain-containing protein [Tenacibaculum sp. ZH5_bin.1]|uniref:DUF262 domain-containing protein n=1 Tax=unclassified Tenacibaculum TaxID=2635139 RepID=UPI0036E5BC57